MPAEWAPHERTLIAWPTRAELWGAHLDAARADHARIARAIAAFEPVTMLVNRRDAMDARGRCGGHVEVVELPLDDSWVRDSGPIGLLGTHSDRAAVDFRFNGWGQKFTPYELDDQLPERLCSHFGVTRYRAPLVLEGGSITVDGLGTLITTEQCLLHPNRNPSLDREEIEARLRRYLGVERILWLGEGLVEDRDTDGHVDNVCAWLGPGRVLLQTVADEADPNFPRAQENRRRLDAALDVRGHHLEVAELDLLPACEEDGRRIAIPYTNLYLCNGAAIVPVAGLDPDMDEEALGRLRALLPGREVVGVPGLNLARGGGGVHCITQQMPAVTPS